MRARFALAVLLLVPVAAMAERLEPVLIDDQKPTVMDPLPFEHAEHKKVFHDLGVRCVECHPVGARAPEGKVGTEVAPPGPRASCHACHRRDVTGAPRRSPGTCSTCHPVREELIPETHLGDWLEAHGEVARGLATGCVSCHDMGTCVECHEARGAKARMPHGPGFRSSHGIEARMDPSSCVTCHSGETCTSCHDSGGIPL